MEDYRLLAEGITDLTLNQKALGVIIGIVGYLALKGPIKNMFDYMMSQVAEREQKLQEEERKYDSLDDRFE